MVSTFEMYFAAECSKEDNPLYQAYDNFWMGFYLVTEKETVSLHPSAVCICGVLQSMLF